MEYGAIEAGGTKFVVAVGDADGQVSARQTIPTTDPQTTLAAVIKFFQAHPVQAMGIGSFGPIDINRQSPTYGYITHTPKPGWADFDFLGTLKAVFDIPYVWTTDVNVAAYGELAKGAAVGCHNVVYLTVGTGIGGGGVVHDQILDGFGHPEMGHLAIRKDPRDDFNGICPYHGACLEGLASGPAIEARLGKSAKELTPTDPFWQIEANYLAQACVAYTLILSPEKIVFGGGVMHQRQLFPMIREAFREQLNTYVATPDLDDYIVPIALNDDAGIIGSLLLAANAN